MEGKTKNVGEKRNKASLAGNDIGRATGSALTVKGDMAVLISTKDNEM